MLTIELTPLECAYMRFFISEYETLASDLKTHEREDMAKIKDKLTQALDYYLENEV